MDVKIAVANGGFLFLLLFILLVSFKWNFLPMAKLKDRRNLMKGDESRGSGGTNTGTSVRHWFVCDGKFTEVSADHGWFDFHDVEMFAVVDSNDGTDHVWQDNHVAKVGFDGDGLFVGSFGLCG